MGFPVSELFFRKSEGLSEADNQRLCRNAGDRRRARPNVGFSARSPSNNLIISWKVYILVMLFTVFFFLQSYSIPILWVVSLDLDFYLGTPTSVSVDPGPLSTSRLRVTVSEIYLDRWFQCSVNNEWNVWAYCVFDHRIIIFSYIKGFCCFSLNFVVREFMYLLAKPEHPDV